MQCREKIENWRWLVELLKKLSNSFHFYVPLDLTLALSDVFSSCFYRAAGSRVTFEAVSCKHQCRSMFNISPAGPYYGHLDRISWSVSCPLKLIWVCAQWFCNWNLYHDQVQRQSCAVKRTFTTLSVGFSRPAWRSTELVSLTTWVCACSSELLAADRNKYLHGYP